MFAQSLSIKAYPLILFYSFVDQDNNGPAAKAAFTVSKKKFARAVDRNRIKRLLREAYRLHKHSFYEKKSKKRLHLVFVYVGKVIEPFHLIEKKMNTLVTEVLSKR